MRRNPLSPFELACALRNAIVIRAAEIFTYHEHWSADFSKSQMLEIVDRLKRSPQFFEIDPEAFNADEMLQLGFMKMTEKSTDRLIPLWILPFLKGDHPSVKKSRKDNDHRMGCLAYGVEPRKEG